MIMISINKLIGGSITITTKPVANPKTKITFTDGSVKEYDWSGEITKQTMMDFGLFNADKDQWVKMPQTAEIGTNVTSIGAGAFSECSRLTNVTIPDGVTSIGYYAFRDCSSMTSMTIPASVTSIWDSAFSYCGFTSVTIPDSVTSIGDSAFSYCGLTSVTITANGGNAENVKQMMINAGVSSSIMWNMPN